MIRVLSRTLLLLSILIPLYSSQAATVEKYQAGEKKDYEILVTPVRTNDPTKIEVAEAFWYGCPHCYHFEPVLRSWLATLPKDVYFVPVPVIWDNDTRLLHAKMYYTAQLLNKLDTLHSAIFAAMNEGNKTFATEADIASFFEANGVDAQTFAKTFDSFSVDSLAKQADAKVRGYGIDGTPTLIINGKYKIMGAPEKMIDVANFLIAKERASMKAGNK